ncbi:DsbA family protein [Leucobacter chromiireducens]|uniref:Disulfide bond formation protein DsbA n=1 Tax=Leucobacter chromiireducens subsp. chromiireducens TaxID=660067 RepID=A0ABS1SL02_9MICO|nr:thioredoxin domain-containing protein [Leucobacter chromiireducens]MBL3688843.1 disulfide bond formation protein DsbA [Leucobacter chromiireducens subsp. chromiireducens]
MSSETNHRPTKNERRAQAREQARVAREQEKKREKRNRLFLQGGIVLGVLAILGIVALVLTQTMKPAGPGPKNMASGAAVFTKDLEVLKTPALESGADREAREVNRDELPLDVTVYADYMCPACGAFEQQYGTMLENYVGAGDIELGIYPLNFLDSMSNGSKYSTRAANLFSCVVEEQPEVAFSLHTRLLSPEVQPKEQTTGLTDDQLLEQAEAAGAELTTELRQCVKDVRFGNFISSNYKSASETGILGLAKGAQMLSSDGVTPQPADGPQRLVSTPTVIVNGQQWNQARDGDLESYLLKVKGEFEQKQDADAKKSE